MAIKVTFKSENVTFSLLKIKGIPNDNTVSTIAI